MIKLNIGGGKGHPRLPGWTVVDLRDGADIRLDISRDSLPFADNSVDVIFTSHTLEHILPQRLPFVLSEFRRVIKAGGMRETADGTAPFEGGLIRILVPDISLAIRAYSERDEKFFQSSEVTVPDPNAPLGGKLAAWFYSMSAVGNGHVHAFDHEYLMYLLRNQGFDGMYRSAFRKSLLAELRDEAFDRHPNDSLFVECWKTSNAATRRVA